MNARVAVLAIMTLVCHGLALSAEENPSAPSVFKADKIERLPDDTLKATGNVEVVGADFRLRADAVELRDVKTPGEQSVEIIAEGHVVLTRGQERLTLQRLEFNPRTRTGTFRLPQD